MSEADRQHHHPPAGKAATSSASDPASDRAGGGHPLLALQRAIGNQAVQRQLRAGALPPALLLGQPRALGNRAVQRALRARAADEGDARASDEGDARAADRASEPAPADGVSPLAQRSAVVGQAGANTPKVRYENAPGDVNQLAADAANAVPNAPGWLAAWLQPHLQALVVAPIAYTFETVLEVVQWILVRELMLEIGRYTAGANPANRRTERGKQMRTDLLLIEPMRQAYDQAGQANQQFDFCGRTYDLVNSGPRHHYASRNGNTIYYAEGFTRGAARQVFAHLRQNGRDANYDGPDLHIDNFVCAFLAEPTRWPVEQIFNLLAIQIGDAQDKVVGESTTALPMAGGSTWEPGLQGAAGTIAHGLPERAIQFATSMGWLDLITQELGPSPGFAQFALAFRQQLNITE